MVGDGVLGTMLIVGVNDKVGITDGAYERDGSLEDVGFDVFIGCLVSCDSVGDGWLVVLGAVLIVGDNDKDGSLEVEGFELDVG